MTLTFTYYKRNLGMPKSPYFLLSVVIVIWGLNYVMGRLLAHPFPLIPGLEYQHMSGTMYGFLRYFFGTITMIFILIYQKKQLKQIKDQINPIRGKLLLSAIFSAIFVLSAHESSNFISSGTTSIIINLCPILVFVYGISFLKEKVNLLKILGFILGFIGGLFFLYNSTVLLSDSAIFGIILALIAMFSWGGYSILLHYMSNYDSYIIMAVKHGMSTLITIPIIVFITMNNPDNFLIIDLWTIIGIIFGGLIATGLAYVLYFKAIESLGAPKATSFLFLVPFVSLLGDIVLGELPQLFSLIGGIIALIGVFLIKFNNEKIFIKK